MIEFRDLARFWPVLLIVAGIVMLYNRVLAAMHILDQPSPMESSHEQ